MKRLQNALQLLGATPRTFLDKLRVGIAVVDARTGGILFANREFAEILGCSSNDLLDDRVSLEAMTHADDRERSAMLQRRLCAGEIDRYDLEKRFLRTDGRIVWAKISVDTIQRTDGATWTIGILEDISDRKVLEKQIGAIEAVATIATWSWNVKSDTTHVSNSFNALHGLLPAVPSPNLAECVKLLHPDDRDGFEATIALGLSKRTGYTIEYRIILANGEVRWLRTTATCLYDAGGEVANLVGATIDITDVKTRRPTRSVSPAMSRVLEYIDANWNKPLSIRNLGDRFGVSSRSIHNHFAAEGTTPNKHIKGIRLRHARQQLLSASETTTVTGVALNCGFSNLGHFAKDYRCEFGEAPSDTMKIPR